MKFEYHIKFQLRGGREWRADERHASIKGAIAACVRSRSGRRTNYWPARIYRVGQLWAVATFESVVRVADMNDSQYDFFDVGHDRGIDRETGGCL
jgi:hypothetical protein